MTEWKIDIGEIIQNMWKIFMCQWLDKKITCTGRWILMLQSLYRLHMILMNGIIIIHLSEWIEFNFDWALNMIEFSIRVTPLFSCMYRKWKKVWMENVKIIDTSFLNVANWVLIIIFRFLCCENYFDKNVSIIFLIASTKN